ncbi:amidohydrolase family protein [Rhodococcus jostii]|uniref:Amidohydrolase family protein n=1 Tax=Rhodococcus jostii TaxID=132919 RepID=A0ABU4CPB0_RHOJO|nr:amidohydrolase family protein [Rhodococcus jostii]MDV6284977.1 amidohydrolase family protein [Rhodococcus jostii]
MRRETRSVFLDDAGSSSESFVVLGARVFNGDDVSESASVLVVGDRVRYVGTGEPSHEGAHVIDGTGKTLLPGLIDAHAHSKPGALAQALTFGVTTEMDMGSSPEWMVEQRELAATRTDVADVRSSSFGATLPGGHPSRLIGTFFPTGFPTVTDPASAYSFVEDRVSEGADYIKLILEDGSAMNREPTPIMPPETAKAVVEAAHDHGKQAFAHVTSLDGANRALDAGIDALVHLFMDEPPTPAIIDRIVDSNIFVVPTLCTLGALSGDHSARWLTEDPRAKPFIPVDWQHSLCCSWPKNPHSRLKHSQQAAIELKRAGARVLTGTDAASVNALGTAHGASLHDEFALLVDAGFTPLEVLRAATSIPADAFGLTDRGRIAPGLLADLVLIDGDPTRHIDHTLSIDSVWRHGTPLDRAARRM